MSAALPEIRVRIALIDTSEGNNIHPVLRSALPLLSLLVAMVLGLRLKFGAGGCGAVDGDEVYGLRPRHGGRYEGFEPSKRRVLWCVGLIEGNKDEIARKSGAMLTTYDARPGQFRLLFIYSNRRSIFWTTMRGA